LVAVGADYNLLLISRIRDECAQGVRTAVIRTVGATGGVITAAGLIFAASMFGLLFASISTLVQAGFVVGVGILLDTFLVRTITVPAIAVLFGEKNWWPSRWRPPAPAARTPEAGHDGQVSVDAEESSDDQRLAEDAAVSAR
jgi:RND superfamily putative drug exporter